MHSKKKESLLQRDNHIFNMIQCIHASMNWIPSMSNIHMCTVMLWVKKKISTICGIQMACCIHRQKPVWQHAYHFPAGFRSHSTALS